MAVTVAQTAAGYICLSRIRGEKLMRKLQQAARDLPTVLEKTTNQGELHEKDPSHSATAVHYTGRPGSQFAERATVRPSPLCICGPNPQS